MFEISDLKAKKLPELQEIAKDLKVPKFKTLKKLDLVYQILDLQASNPKVVAESTVVPTEPAPARPHKEKTGPKPRRERAPRAAAPEANAPRPEASERAPEAEPTERKVDSKGHPPKKENKLSGPQKTQTPARRTNPPQSQNQSQQSQNQHPNQIQPNHQHQKPTHHDKKNNNFDKDLKNRYKEPEFEFDSIIESEGVLDIMLDGYGFLRSSDYNYLSS